MRKRISFNLMNVVSTCLTIGSICVIFCLLYIWQRNQIIKTGYRINILKEKIEETDQMINRVETKIEILKSPDKILQKIPADLKITSGDRVVHLPKIHWVDSIHEENEEIAVAQIEKPFLWRWLEEKLSLSQKKSQETEYIYVKNSK